MTSGSARQCKDDRLMADPKKIKVSGESGIVLINIQEHPSLGKVIRISDIGIYFPNSVGLSFSVGEATSVCSGSEDGKFVLMPPEGWTAPVYTAVVRKTDKKFSFSQWKKTVPMPSQAKKQKTHCTLEIGVMVLKAFDLVKVRRSSSLGIGSVAINVRVDASADDILEAATKEHLLVHKAMEETYYTLLYPDKTRVKYVPGKNLAFSPGQYLRHSTLTRFRDIKLFLCTVDEYNAFRSQRKNKKKMLSGQPGPQTPGPSGKPDPRKGKTGPSGKPDPRKGKTGIKKGILKRPAEEQVPTFKDTKYRKEVSFKPHLDTEDNQDSTLSTDGSSELQSIDTYGFIEVTYSKTDVSLYGGHNETEILFTDRRHAMDHALGYEPIEGDITRLNPVDFGTTVAGIQKGGTTFLLKDEESGFQFPSHTGQSGMILHGPDVIHGFDGHGIICGVIAISHDQPAMMYSWTRDGIPVGNGPKLSIIPINQAGSYQCTVTFMDKAEISEAFHFKVVDEQQQGGKNVKVGDEQEQGEKNVEVGDEQEQGEENVEVGDEQQKKEKHVEVGDEQQKKEKHVEDALQMIDRNEINFKEENEIGHGSYGTVYKGQWSGTTVAVKAIQTRQIMRSTKSLMHEAQIHTKLSHPNILQLMGVSVTRLQLLLLTPFIHGRNLEELIFPADETILKMDDEKKGYLSWQAAKAVAYLHNIKPPVLHQDIKPANFILEEKTNILRLMDLGLAVLKSAVSISKGGTVPSNPAGTPMYTGPEMYKDREPPAESSDVWSLACTLTELSTASPIWEDEGNEEEDFVLASYKKSLLPTAARKLQTPMKEILMPCFKYNTKERASALWLVEELTKTFDNTTFLGYEL